MDITYLGGASFLLKGGKTIAINPTDRAASANIVLHSRRQPKSKNIINGPGEYEIGGILVVTLEKQPGPASNLIHGVDIDGLNVVHLGNRVDTLTDRDLTDIGKVDILIVNAEDLQTATQMLQDLLPRVVIPFGSHAAELCAAAGIHDAAAQPRFSWNGSGTAPKAVLLKAPGNRRKAA